MIYDQEVAVDLTRVVIEVNYTRLKGNVIWVLNRIDLYDDKQ